MKHTRIAAVLDFAIGAQVEQWLWTPCGGHAYNNYAFGDFDALGGWVLPDTFQEAQVEDEGR